MHISLTRQQLRGVLADPLDAAIAHEPAVVQDELQQAQVRIARVASQEEPAQPRVLDLQIPERGPQKQS